jgi:hypothetical protein
VRCFYSMMACAFSHSVFEPVEHRWGWGQYFGPPSTDGAWFELFRNMLIRETDADELFLLQATPRGWLENAKMIRIDSAPTYFGDVSLLVESRSDNGQIRCDIGIKQRRLPQAILVRLRHPTGRQITSVRVNDMPWSDYDSGQEWVRIPNPHRPKYRVEVHY